MKGSKLKKLRKSQMRWDWNAPVGEGKSGGGEACIRHSYRLSKFSPTYCEPNLHLQYLQNTRSLPFTLEFIYVYHPADQNKLFKAHLRSNLFRKATILHFKTYIFFNN